MHSYSRQVLGISIIQSERFLALLHDYEVQLFQAGYHNRVTHVHLRSVVHFGIWLERQGLDLEKIDDGVVLAFERHRSRCRCPRASQNQNLVSCVRVFLRRLRLRQGGSLADPEAGPQPPSIVAGFLQWMRIHRGVVDTTLASYQYYVTNLVGYLGEDPQRYTAAGLRYFLAKRYQHYAPRSMRMVLAAVRMFLRYLTLNDRCPVGLDQALVSPPSWSQQSLPRGLSSDEVDRVLVLCPRTATGIRDRAILLMLLRLGLRAGDVAALRFTDVSFETATLRVRGKGGRESRLPLPQDVGDALLDYLHWGRPRSESDCVFLGAIAPFQPLGSKQKQPGQVIKQLARNALKRAGIQPPTPGAHVFRHTAACRMLDAGVSLEDIAAVLRHRSIETTALYAKVDLQMLKQVAQPWPEVSSC